MTGNLTDEELVDRTRAGEEDAFSELYERYRRHVFSAAFRILQNTEEALDASQDIFVKIYRSLESWDPDKSKFSTWLYRLATNHAIDCWRSRRRRAETDLSEDFRPEISRPDRTRDAIRSPYQRLAAREVVDEVRRCVDDLPELQKKVFVLRYFQELKLEEIAEVEECSLGTVKTSLFRATRFIRKRVRRFL